MEKLIITICFLFPMLLMAQVEKGFTSIDGRADISYTDYGDDEPSFRPHPFMTSLTPFKSWWITDNLEIGGGVSLFVSGGEGDGTVSNFLRFSTNYYLNPSSDKFNFFISGEASYGYRAFGGSYDGGPLNLNLGLGALRFLNSSVAVEGRVGVQHYIDDLIDFTRLHLTFRPKAILATQSKLQEQESNEIEKGTWMIGGTGVGMSYVFSNNSYTINLHPKILYVHSNRWVFGGALGVHYSSFGPQEILILSNQLQTSISPEFRYYLTPLNTSKGLKWFGRLTGSITYTNSFGGDFRVDSHRTDVSISGGLGANYFLTPNLALEGTLSYRHFRNDIDTNQGNTNTVGASLSLQYLWNRK